MTNIPVARTTAGNVVQNAQAEIGHLQMTYRDSQPAFWALAVAWEAIRFAWYVLDDDLGSAQAKLARVKEAINDFERTGVRH
jgi:hypothetical protein